MTLRNASFIYREFGIPRNLLRQLAEANPPAVRSEVVLAPDGINRMKVYCCEDCERVINGGSSPSGEEHHVEF